MYKDGVEVKLILDATKIGHRKFADALKAAGVPMRSGRRGGTLMP